MYKSIEPEYNPNELIYDKVIFRTFKDGDVIALIPELPGDMQPRNCLSYMHLGQHSAADYNYIMKCTRKSTLEEKLPLINELESIGYLLDETTRQSIQMFYKRVQALKVTNMS